MKNPQNILFVKKLNLFRDNEQEGDNKDDKGTGDNNAKGKNIVQKLTKHLQFSSKDQNLGES